MVKLNIDTNKFVVHIAAIFLGMLVSGALSTYITVSVLSNKIAFVQMQLTHEQHEITRIKKDIFQIIVYGTKNKNIPAMYYKYCFLNNKQICPDLYKSIEEKDPPTVNADPPAVKEDPPSGGNK